MKYLKKLGLATAVALVATCGIAGAASATTIEPANTAFTLTSTNSILNLSGGGSVSCNHSVLTSDTPALSHGTWGTATVTTLAYSGCNFGGLGAASVTPSEGCHTAATSPRLHLMGVNAASAIGTLTLPAACSIDMAIPAIGCTLTITGGQTIGNGTPGAGGINWTNLVTSNAHVNGATVPLIDSNGVGFPCPTAGAHTGTLTGTFVRTSATNVTVTAGTTTTTDDPPPSPVTTIEPANTGVTLTATNSTFVVDPDNVVVGCNDSIITGDTGALTQATWAGVTITSQTYNNCTTAGGLFASVTPNEGCSTAAGRPILHAMGVNAATAVGRITLPATCSIDIDVPITGCTVTITGGQTIGNGTAGIGGIDWTNLGTGSVAHLNKADVPLVDSNGTGAFCPTAGAHTGTLSGDYAITSATNVTVTAS
jgi:hypothetical protein